MGKSSTLVLCSIAFLAGCHLGEKSVSRYIEYGDDFDIACVVPALEEVEHIRNVEYAERTSEELFSNKTVVTQLVRFDILLPNKDVWADGQNLIVNESRKQLDMTIGTTEIARHTKRSMDDADAKDVNRIMDDAVDRIYENCDGLTDRSNVIEKCRFVSCE